MSFRQDIIGTFKKDGTGKLVWQPRLEQWYSINKKQGTLPDRYKNMELLDLYRDLGASIRTYHMFNSCFRTTYSPEIKFETEKEKNRTIRWWITPVGRLRQVYYHTDTANQCVEFPAKTADDLDVIEYILTHSKFEFDEQQFNEFDKALGDLGAPFVYLPRVTLQRLFIQYMGFENTIFALHDNPQKLERFCKVMVDSEDELYELVCRSPIEIINFGDNVHSDMLPPTLFEQYVLPVYRKRVEQLHGAGKFVHAHWDGFVKPLLPYAHETRLDALEALTPVPQGDVTIEEIKEHLGDDIILIDGLPCTHFLPFTPLEELEETTYRLIDMFKDQLILGISDELSPPGDIERVRFVADIVSKVR